MPKFFQPFYDAADQIGESLAPYYRERYKELEERGRNLHPLIGKLQEVRDKHKILEAHLRGKDDADSNKIRADSKALIARAEKLMSPSTPEELSDLTRMEGSGRPVDFIEPYYGKHFARELRQAVRANEERKVLDSDSYERLFDVVPMQRKSSPYYYYYKQGVGEQDRVLGRVPGGASVVATDKEGLETGKFNAAVKDAAARGDKARVVELMKSAGGSGQIPDEDWRDLVTQSREMLLSNAYRDFIQGESNTPRDALEHEYSHHFLRPTASIKGFVSRLKHKSRQPMHMLSGAEFTQALARTNREFFKHTEDTTGRGRRMSSEDLEHLIRGSEKDIDFLSPEGQRSIRGIRNYMKSSSPEAGEQLIKGAQWMLPTLVEAPKRFFPEQQMA